MRKKSLIKRKSFGLLYTGLHDDEATREFFNVLIEYMLKQTILDIHAIEVAKDLTRRDRRDLKVIEKLLRT